MGTDVLSTPAESPFHFAFEAASQGMLLATLDGKVMAINRALRDLIGHGESSHDALTIPALLSRPEQMCDVMEQLYEQGRFDDLELAIRRSDGSPGTLRMNGVRLPTDDRCFLGTVVVEPSAAADAAGANAAGLKAVERLASGVAHDLNNVLSALAGYCHLLKQPLEHIPQALDDLAAVEDAGDRAAAIVRQLRAVGQKQMVHPEVLTPAARINALEGTLRRLMPADVSLEVTASDDEARILIDRDVFDEIAAILVLNATKAMPHGGSLHVRTTVLRGDRRFCLDVTDSGAGLQPAEIEKCFDPFASTHAANGYSGLALAAVHSLVVRSGGTVSVESATGLGTTFRVMFPLVQPAPSAAAQPDRALPAPSPDAAGKTILLVEDDPPLRLLARRVLQLQGYTVVEARSGEEALELLASSVQTVDLLITDMMMPGIKGWDVGRAVREKHPDCALIFMSGYTTDPKIRQQVPEDGLFLGKPFAPPKLAEIVSTALRGAP